MKKRTLKKLLVLMLSIVMMLSIVPTSANESSAYDYSWMDEYTDEEFLAISGLTKEEWKIEYPDLTFEDFNLIQTYAGVGETYDLGGTSVYCESTDHPAVGTLSNSGYVVNCSDKTKASPFDWSTDLVDNLPWTTETAPSSYRDIYWNLYKGLFPSYSNGLAIYNSQGISQGETTGFGALTLALTSASGNTTTAPYASAFYATSASGSAVTSGANLTVTNDASTQKTSTITLNTGTPYIYTSVVVPNGVTIYYNSTGSWQSGTNSTGAAKTYVLANGTQVYFTAPLSRSATDTITFSAVCTNVDGSYTTGYYIDAIYSFVPNGRLTSTNNGSTYDIQTLSYPTAKTASYSLVAPWVAYGSLKIVKTSSNPSVSEGNSCYSLQGAVYTVYRYASDAQAGTNPYATITLDANGEGVLNNIPAGTYYVKETTAPKGYALNSSITPVTVNAGATAVHNTQDVPQMDPGRISVMKQGDNGKLLEGAEFTVKFYEGVNVNTDPSALGYTADKTWILKTNEDGVAIFDNSCKISGDDFYIDQLTGYPALPLGTLTIQESKAPEGYFIDDTIYVRKITSDGTSTSVSTYNAPIITDEVFKQPFQLTKYIETDDGSKKPLEGAGFSVCNVADLQLDAEGNYIWDDSKVIEITADGSKEMFTDENGYVVSIPLEYGTYVVRETTVPTDCFAVEDFIVEITEDSDEPQEMRYFTDEVFKGYVKIIKIDEETGESILNNSASFKIWSYEKNDYVSFDGETVLSTNDKGELITPKPLFAGKYRIEEVSAPEGYVLSKETYDIEITSVDTYETYIDEDGNETKMGIFTTEIENAPIKGSVKLIKHDMENYEKTLQGVKFELYMKNESGDILMGEYVTDEKGEINVDKLYYGDYYLVETETLYRYNLNTEKQYFSITENGVTVELHMTNDGRIGTLSVWGFDGPSVDGSHGVRTGDNFNIASVIVLMLLSATGIVLLTMRLKKDETRR